MNYRELEDFTKEHANFIYINNEKKSQRVWYEYELNGFEIVIGYEKNKTEDGQEIIYIYQNSSTVFYIFSNDLDHVSDAVGFENFNLMYQSVILKHKLEEELKTNNNNQPKRKPKL